MPDERPSTGMVWLLAIRPATLTAGIAPVVLGTAIAAAMGQFALWPAVGAMAAAILVQIGTNLANDYYDFKKGADNDDRIGPARATQKGWLAPEEVARGTAVVLVMAALVGAALAVHGGWPVVAIAIVSLIAAVAYTAGPFPLAYVGLGDVFVLVFFGPVAVSGTIYVQTLTWPIEGLVAGAALGCLATAILVVNNLRDRHTDAAAGKRTLAVRFGATAARWEYTVLVLSAFALVAGWNVVGGGWGWLVPLVALPLGLMQIRTIWTTDGAALNPHLGSTARLTLIFAALTSGGMLVGMTP